MMETDAEYWMRRRNEAIAERNEAVMLLREAQNALLDYVERLEKHGGMMNYGRNVLASIDAYLAKANP